MNVITAYQTKNDCYKTAQKMTPKGIVVHSTGANNTSLSRYVDAPEIVGVNKYGNHWNRSGVSKMVHGFIGKDKNGKVAVINTLPYNYCCWGCGKGKNGSYNYSPAYIQFEVCEDNLKSAEYFNSAIGAAIQYCADLCKKYNIPLDKVVSHKEAHTQGYASNHRDIDHWLGKFGKDMNWFREQVRAAMYPTPVVVTPKPTLSVGDIVMLTPNATVYGKPKHFSSWVYGRRLYVRQIDGERVVVSTYKIGAVTGAVHISHLKKV